MSEEFFWLEDVYSFVQQNKLDDAIDVLFYNIDDLLLAGELYKCDCLLKTIDLKRLDTNLVVALLSITKSAKHKLSERASFVLRALNRLNELSPDRVSKMISGLT